MSLTLNTNKPDRSVDYLVAEFLAKGGRPTEVKLGRHGKVKVIKRTRG